jgi:hypothetical protein
MISSAPPPNQTDRGLWTRPLGCWQRFRASPWSLTQPTARCLRFRPGLPSDWCGNIHYDIRMAPPGEETDNMLSPEKDRLAAEAMQCWADFQEGLSSDKQKYPVQQFRAFWAVTKLYAELTRSDPLIHRSVAGAVNGLLDFLDVERKRVPDDVLRDAERLQCLLFNGYDPHFEGDEPPGL